jgi:hypothetical protein
MKTYEELAVLEQGEDGAIIEIRGEDAPFVLLGAKYLGHLTMLLRAADADVKLQSLEPDDSAIAALCAEMRSLLTTYDETCLKYFGNLSDAKKRAESGFRRDHARGRTVAEIEAEIEELRKELDKY